MFKKLFVPALFCLSMAHCTSDKTDSTNTSSNPQSSESAASVAACCKLNVAPPLKNVDVAAEVFTVEPSKARTITCKNGSVIQIPASAFVNKQGQPVTLPVRIKYRAFLTPGEIIASGIPMKAYNKEGKEGWFQTAGMYEIEGTTEQGEEVFIAPDKKLDINMPTTELGKYDSWYFDKTTGNWQDIGDSEPIENTASAGESPAENGEITAASAALAAQNGVVAPVKPVLFDKSKPSLNFRVDYSEFPELKAMKGMVLQYAGKDPKLDPSNNKWIFKHAWEKVKLDKNPKSAGQFVLNLESDSTELSLPVSPSLSGQDYEATLQKYQKEMADYRKAMANFATREAYAKKQRDYIRSMNIGNFGIFNYDILWHNCETIPVIADFDFGGGVNELAKSDIHVFMVTKGGKMVVDFPISDWDKFAIMSKEKTQLIAVMPDGKIAVLKSTQLEALMPEIVAKKGKEYVFQMPPGAKSVNSPKDIDRALAL